MESELQQTKEELASNVRQWIALDGEISELTKQMMTIKQQIQQHNAEKKQLTNAIISSMKTMNVGNIDLKNNRSLVHKVSKTKKPLSIKYLVSKLNEYFKDDPNTAVELSHSILSGRDIVVKESIKIIQPTETVISEENSVV